jgi:hypothetical protein
MDIEIVAGDSSSASADGSASPVAAVPAASVSPDVATPNDNPQGPITITRTRHHTKTVPGEIAVVTKTITEILPQAAFNPNNIVVQTIQTEKWVTVTRTV